MRRKERFGNGTTFDENVLNQIYGDSRRNSQSFRADEQRETFAESRENNRRQLHTHEYLGSVKIAEEEDPHNHRFAGVTGEAIPIQGGSHVHKLEGNTDFYEEHFHIVADRTGPAIPVGGGRHVHFAKGQTTLNDGHRHEFIFATLIEDPIGD